MWFGEDSLWWNVTNSSPQIMIYVLVTTTSHYPNRLLSLIHSQSHKNDSCQSLDLLFALIFCLGKLVWGSIQTVNLSVRSPCQSFSLKIEWNIHVTSLRNEFIWRLQCRIHYSACFRLAGISKVWKVILTHLHVRCLI